MDGLLEDAASALAELASRPVYGLSDQALCDELSGLYRLASQAIATTALRAVEAQGRDLPHRAGATGAVAWLRDLLRVAPAEARALVSLGEVLDARPVLAGAAEAGDVNASQAVAIGRVLADVPCEDPGLVDKVETTLVGYAAEFEPTMLRRLGERVLAHLDPELADRRLRDRLEDEERRARKRRGFTLGGDGLGGTRLHGTVDAEAAAIITAALDPLSRTVRGVDGPDLRTPAARRADALVEVCRLALACGGLPDNGGQPPQVNVTINYETLRRNVAVGQLDTGGLLSPATTRRLACTAQILPVVLDGAGIPVDVGRARRLFTGAARQAVLLRDGGCAFPGCDRPARWCAVHHIVAWVDGGGTDRTNGVTLCNHHHRLIHHSDWTVRVAPDGRPEFLPPTHIDPERRPRRNPYHPRR